MKYLVFSIIMSLSYAHATTVMMIHGGGWKYGDANNPKVFDNKKSFFESKNISFLSLNYPLIPNTTVEHQIDSLTEQVSSYMLSHPKEKVILMGHSAGAHLALMVAARMPSLSGVVSLDTAAIDLENIMRKPHLPLYDDAFPSRPDWEKLSPLNVWHNTMPVHLVCSTERRLSCPDNSRFVQKYKNVTLDRVNKSHGAINEDFGKDMDYTNRIFARMQQW